MTYLTNSKMGPELRARIEASVRGKSAASPRISPGIRTLLRLGAVLLVVGLASFGVVEWRYQRQRLQSAKTELLADLGQVKAKLKPAGERLWSTAAAELVRASATYPGDLVDPSLRPADLASLLERPAVYVRGPVGSFADVASQGPAIAESGKDAFILCLLDPPAGTTEKELLPKVLIAHRRGGAEATGAAQLYRLQDALAARPFLEDAWQERVRSADSLKRVHQLHLKMDRAHLERAVRAVQAEIFIYLLDEPKKPGTASELDGASDHFVRVGILEIEPVRTVLRLRQRVDPSWIASNKRVYLARGLNGCKLAVDIHQDLKPQGTD